VDAGVADQLNVFTFVLAVTETVCPTATCVAEAAKEILLLSEFDLLQANKTVAGISRLKKAFFIIDFFEWANFDY
jgi:hypothetical protein